MLLMVGGLFVSLLIVAAYTLGRRIGHNKTKHKMGELPSDAGIRDMLFEGRIDDAIEAYRQFTGVDEFTAKQAIDDMQRELHLTDEIQQEVKRLMKAGNKAGAIEAYQTATGATLAEALEYVEAPSPRRR
jgi:hypothetical protein